MTAPHPSSSQTGPTPRRTEPVVWTEPMDAMPSVGPAEEPDDTRSTLTPIESWPPPTALAGLDQPPWPQFDEQLAAARLPPAAVQPVRRQRRRARTARANLQHDGAGEGTANRWLVSYADFLTLLLGFFVVMYAMSSINEEKYQEMSKSLAGIFENSSLSTKAIQVGEPQEAVSTDIVDTVESPGFESAEKGDTQMRTSMENVESALGGFAEQEGLNVATNDHWLEISLDSEIAFDGQSAELTPEARALLKRTATWLATFDHPITIEGYTDNIPADGSRYGSNWQLSSARASAVAEFLSREGIDETRMSAVGYGENHPLATNATPKGRATNRRVVLVVAHNGNLPRNLNTAPETSAFAFVRHEDEVPTEVLQRRTSKGGLIFSNE